MREAFDIYGFLWYFVIYSFLGWCVEVIYHALNAGEIVNRGFLNGPFCPIYGFGMTAILGFFDHIMSYDFKGGGGAALFAGGMLITTSIELFGGWTLDKLFHVRWWDYSDRPFNLHGYICPEFSIYWGLGTVFVYRIVHPTVSALSVNLIPKGIGWVLLALIFAAFFADAAVTVAVLIGLNKRLKELDRLRNDMRRFSDELTDKLADSAIANANRLEHTRVQASLAGMEAREDLEARRRKAELRYAELRSRIYRHRTFGVTRLVRSFPKASHDRYSELFELIKENVNKRGAKPGQS